MRTCVRFLALIAFLFALAPILALAQVEPASISPAPDEPVVTLVNAVIAVVVLAAGWVIRTFVKHVLVQRALLLVTRAARVGVSSAWGTYTSRIKAGRADGQLTEDEKKHAREEAWKAALRALGAEGQTLVQKALKDGWEEALKAALEAEYQEAKPHLQG